MKILKSIALSAVVASTMLGSVTVPTSGWNLMGAMENITTAQLFGDSSKVISVWKWDAYGKRWLAYSPNQATQTAISALTYNGSGIPLASSISTGEGYWINVTSTGATTYTAGSTTVTAPTLNSSSPATNFSMNQNTYYGSYPFNGYFLNIISGTTTYSTTFNIPGMTLNTATGIVSGTPTTAGNYTGTITACNGSACVTTGNFTITVATTSGTQTNQPPVFNLSHSYDTTTGNHNTIYVAKGLLLTTNLAYHAHDNEGDTIVVTTSNPQNLPTGLSVSSTGALTGNVTGDTTGTVSVTLSDNSGSGATYQTTLHIIPIDPAVADNESNKVLVYGTDDMANINLTSNNMTFFEPDEDDGVPYLGVITLNGTAGTYGEYKINSSSTDLVTPDTADIETFTLSNKSATSTNATFIDGGGSERFTITAAIGVNSINGISTTGLKEATVEFTTLVAKTPSTTTDWWNSHYTTWNQETNSSVSITDLTTLKNMFLTQNWANVWMSEDMQVKLAGTTTATSGEVIGMGWDGTYSLCTSNDCGSPYYKNMIPGSAMQNASWTLDSNYLTVVTPMRTKVFKVESGQLKETEIDPVGSVHTGKWFYGPTLEQFKTIYLQVENASTN